MCFFIHICWGSWFSVFLVDYILLLFILMFKLFFIWPTRAHSCWLLCPCSHHSLSMSLLFVTGICSGLILYCSCLILESAIFLGILDPFTGEWHLEAKISVPVCLLLVGLSLLPGLHNGWNWRAHTPLYLFGCLYLLKMMNWHQYLQFQSNTQGFILVFFLFYICNILLSVRI